MAKMKNLLETLQENGLGAEALETLTTEELLTLMENHQ